MRLLVLPLLLFVLDLVQPVDPQLGALARHEAVPMALCERRDALEVVEHRAVDAVGVEHLGLERRLHPLDLHVAEGAGLGHEVHGPLRLHRELGLRLALLRRGLPVAPLLGGGVVGHQPERLAGAAAPRLPSAGRRALAPGEAVEVRERLAEVARRPQAFTTPPLHVWGGVLVARPPGRAAAIALPLARILRLHVEHCNDGILVLCGQLHRRRQRLRRGWAGAPRTRPLGRRRRCRRQQHRGWRGHCRRQLHAGSKGPLWRCGLLEGAAHAAAMRQG
mmetsp:Transcript_65821/g.206158  ORF Transcript_65821/g.206158 Transcript_65821/m.206158 type:complete len:277 (+) Transcript_65821:787-1617(+)